MKRSSQRVRPSDVYFTRAKYKAVAECEYPSPAAYQRCHWSVTPTAWDKDADVRRDAREHVRLNPGHSVVVVVRDVTRYYLQASLVAALTADTPSGDGDDALATETESRED